jgi:hypothetical protein
LSWAWEYAFGAEATAHTAPPAFLTAVERKAAELVRAADARYLHGRAYDGDDPKGWASETARHPGTRTAIRPVDEMLTARQLWS